MITNEARELIIHHGIFMLKRWESMRCKEVDNLISEIDYQLGLCRTSSICGEDVTCITSTDYVWRYESNKRRKKKGII